MVVREVRFRACFAIIFSSKSLYASAMGFFESLIITIDRMMFDCRPAVNRQGCIMIPIKSNSRVIIICYLQSVRVVLSLCVFISSWV